MSRVQAAIGSTLFFFLAPGTVAALIPWWITRWRFPEPSALTLAGAILTFVALVMLIECFARFALKGLGTPAPVAPTQHLVVSGLYRFVRNPMYVAVMGLVIGQVLIFQSAPLSAYAIILWLCFHTFVFFYEEPTLRRSFGDEYEAYSKAVPRWLPRLTPWSPEPPQRAGK
jgi:protein-S-isoprenylcysteine O-methyltransferase Ste14